MKKRDKRQVKKVLRAYCYCVICCFLILFIHYFDASLVPSFREDVCNSTIDILELVKNAISLYTSQVEAFLITDPTHSTFQA